MHLKKSFAFFLLQIFNKNYFKRFILDTNR